MCHSAVINCPAYEWLALAANSSNALNPIMPSGLQSKTNCPAGQRAPTVCKCPLLLLLTETFSSGQLPFLFSSLLLFPPGRSVFHFLSLWRHLLILAVHTSVFPSLSLKQPSSSLFALFTLIDSPHLWQHVLLPFVPITLIFFYPLHRSFSLLLVSPPLLMPPCGVTESVSMATLGDGAWACVTVPQPPYCTVIVAVMP